MDTFIQLTRRRATLGSIYALIALGYTMVYGILKLLNFAHGDVFMIGAYIGFGVLQLFGGSADPAISIWLLILADGARRDGRLRRGRGRDRAVRLPAAARAPRIAPLISALGVSFFLPYAMQLLIGAAARLRHVL